MSKDSANGHNHPTLSLPPHREQGSWRLSARGGKGFQVSHPRPTGVRV